MYKAEQDRRLIHVLMGLNEVYTTVRGNILMMVVLPTMAQAFAILCQEDRQREMKPHNSTVLDPTSLIASSSTHSGKGYKTICNSSRGSASISDSGSAANAFTSEEGNNQSEENDELRRQVPMNLSKNQYEQLLNLLETLQVGNNYVDNSRNMLSGAVNLADSGASHHMTYNKLALKNIRPLPYPFVITLLNGYKVKVNEVGDVCLNPVLTLHKGPSLKSPLELGIAKNGLYFLCNKCHNYSVQSNGNSSSQIACHYSTCKPVPFMPSDDSLLAENKCKASPSSIMIIVDQPGHICSDARAMHCKP
ncbi:hypothetical protein KY289_024591 [Solanum tuberosum]|nr:hypothetical protein KY289_024591 [Solanum tuberosum]